MFYINKTVAFSESAPDGKIKITDMMDYFQDVCTFQSEELGIGLEALKARGFGWVASSWQIVVNRYPDLIKKIILQVPCIIPGVKQGRVEPHTVIEKDDELLSSLTKDERDSFTLMNVVLTKEVWERYKKYLMPALESADWDFLNNVLEGSFSFDPDDLKEPCTIPCLIIAAKQDTEVGYKDQFDLMEKYTNATYCAVERAGHNLQIEQPEIFGSLVRNWLLTH